MGDKKKSDCSIEDHVSNATAEVRKMFLLLNPKILELKDVENYARSNYIGYKRIELKPPFIEMHFRKRTNKIELHLRPVNCSSSKLNVRKVPDSHLWKLNIVVSIFNKDEIGSAMDLIRKSFDHILE